MGTFSKIYIYIYIYQQWRRRKILLEPEECLLLTRNIYLLWSSLKTSAIYICVYAFIVHNLFYKTNGQACIYLFIFSFPCHLSFHNRIIILPLELGNKDWREKEKLCMEWKIKWVSTADTRSFIWVFNGLISNQSKLKL